MITKSDIAELVGRARNMSAALQLGERIGWGSDTSLMDALAAALEAQQAEIARLVGALREIEEFGCNAPGCGFTCAAKARAALKAWEGNEDG